MNNSEGYLCNGERQKFQGESVAELLVVCCPLPFGVCLSNTSVKSIIIVNTSDRTSLYYHIVFIMQSRP